MASALRTATPTDPRLWCVHSIGPDDLNAAPDFDTAEKWAAETNAMLNEFRKANNTDADPNWPVVRCVVALWPWSAESHAEDLPKSIAEFAKPETEQVAK